MADQKPAQTLPPFDFGKILQVIQLLAQYEQSHPNAIRDLVTLVTAITGVFAAPQA